MLQLLADSVLKCSLMLLAAGALTLALRRASAAARHLVWALAFAGVLTLPVASAALPDWGLPAWPRLARIAVPPDAGPSPRIATGESPAPAGTEPVAPASPALEPGAGAAARPPVPWDWTTPLLPLWLAGLSLVLATLGLALGRVVWMARTAAPVGDAGWQTLLASLARELHVGRPVRLLCAAGPAMPMTWGLRRPVILLPADADAWSADRRRAVLLHELAHVKRYDVATQLVARVACALYWFNPLVWLAAGRLRVERERACDDQVLRAGARPSDYANHLLAIARSLRVAPGAALASVAMARPSQLAGRLVDVLDPSRRRSGVPRHIAVPAWIAASGLVLPLAAAAPAASRDAGVGIPASVTRQAADTTRATAGGSRGSAIRSPSPDSLRGCPANRGASRRSSHWVNDGMVVSTTVGRCNVSLTAEGRFTFIEDFTDIATVSRGGEAVIEVDYGDHERRVELRPGADGGVERVYKVDGAVRPFDADARAWLAETLTFLLRQTGVAAEERAGWILSRRGIAGLLEEITHLGGDYARRLYYQVAIGSGRLDAAGFERVVTQAGRDIDSDYELAELLIAVAAARPLTPELQAGFVAAARTIASDYETRRVLGAALSSPGLSAEVAAAMLQVAADIGSDYELAELLIGINRARPIDDAVRPAFFAAANTLQSDYEHRRVLAAVVPRQGMSRSMLQSTLESAKTIGSDYELAELLSEIAGAYVLDETLRAPFFAAVNTIGSDHERARTLASLLDRRDVAPPVVLGLLESAKAIGSDYELAELLVKVARTVRVDAALRPAFLEAARALGSTYEHDRVMTALARASGSAELE